MKNIKNFAEHIKENYDRYTDDEYSSLSKNDFDLDIVGSRSLDEEEENDIYLDDDENFRGTVDDENYGDSYSEFEDEEDDDETDNDYSEDDIYLNDNDDSEEPYNTYAELGKGYRPRLARFADDEDYLDTIPDDYQEEEEDLETPVPVNDNDIIDFNRDSKSSTTDTVVGNIHPTNNEGGYANLIDAHGTAINTGDKVSDLHHGGYYIVKELDPFKVIDVDSGRIFGADYEPDRFVVSGKGHSTDPAHHRERAMHDLSTKYNDDHELCQTELGFTPSSYDHVLHSKQLHDKLMGL